MTQKQLNQTGYIINVKTKTVEPIIYEEYLYSHGRDITTTPNGVADRLHIREVEIEDGLQYQIWSWGPNGNRPYYFGFTADNEPDAKMFIYKYWKKNIETDGTAIPFFKDYNEAVEVMADAIGRKVNVVSRYLNIKAITSRKEREWKERERLEYETRKAALVQQVPAEAATITIDQAFKDALAWAAQAQGNEKSQRCASAMKGLLSRNGKENIESDFWQVFRLLKKKAEATLG